MEREVQLCDWAAIGESEPALDEVDSRGRLGMAGSRQPRRAVWQRLAAELRALVGFRGPRQGRALAAARSVIRQ